VNRNLEASDGKLWWGRRKRGGITGKNSNRKTSGGREQIDYSHTPLALTEVIQADQGKGGNFGWGLDLTGRGGSG